MISLFLSKVIKTNKGNYLYDAVHNKIIAIPDEVLVEIEKGNFSTKYNNFIKKNNCRDFSKPINFNIEYSAYNIDELTWLIRNKFDAITLSVTENCNLRCEYCAYMPKYLTPMYKLKNMSLEIAFKAIDLLMKNSKQSNKLTLAFYGGEPFLRFDFIQKCIEYCKEKYPFKIPEYCVTTNGLLLSNDEIIDFVIKNGFLVSVSLDGPEKIHNEHRVNAFNLPSFKEVWEGLNKLYKRDPSWFKNHVNISSVQTPCNICEEQYEFLDDLWKNDVLLADVFVTEHFKEILNSKTKASIPKSSISKYTRFGEKSFLSTLKSYHNSIKTEVNTNSIFPGGCCVPGIGRNFITSDGKIILCERVDEDIEYFTIGDVWNGINVDKINALINEFMQKAKKCKSCWASRLSNICFKDMFNLNNEQCKICSERVYSNLKYYLENIKNDKEYITCLENISVQQ